MLHGCSLDARLAMANDYDVSRASTRNTTRTTTRVHTKLFADLIGIPVMVESSPYAERIREYRPFICSNFILPVLVRICPRGEKLDR